MSSIVIYTTSTCPYCIRAKQLLDTKNVTYIEHRVDLNENLKIEMQQKSRRFTVPQIFIGDFHVGGFDDMYLMDLNEELDQLLFSE